MSSPSNRRQRRLPHALRPCRNPLTSPTFYSYQSALQWIRTQQDVISQCVQLVQIYPNLIKDESMDAFWEFLEPLMGQAAIPDAGTMLTSKSISRNIRDTKRYGVKTRSQGPSNVTEPGPSTTVTGVAPMVADDKTPRVHLISHCQAGSADVDRLLHDGVLRILLEEFYTRQNRHGHTGLPSLGTSIRDKMADTDVCVYLFNEATMEDTACFNELCVALELNIPIVYVRYHKHTKTDKLPDIILRKSNGFQSLKDYMDNHRETLRPSSSTVTKNSIGQRDKLEPLSIKSRPSSANDKMSGSDRMSGSDKLSGSERKRRKHSQVSSEIDLVYTLVNSFKHACAFDESDPAGSALHLKRVVHEKLGNPDQTDPTQSATCDELTIKAPHTSKHNGLVETSERFLSTNNRSSDNEAETAAESSRYSHGGAQLVKLPPLELPTTTYLIFDRDQNNVGPRRVEFPLRDPREHMVDSDVDPEEMEPPNSPIQYHEIDLSRKINDRLTPDSD
ncbi:uncharacterized protein LOC131944499 [Physella acuta]|uniref:uncharacterized protein LOC131944499 n=1 Tax=Physella acuta TaxID=109671 RepID=UPI0027DBDD26|nr:uncharacterized protein LOC131944499 [Physella acuta]